MSTQAMWKQGSTLHPAFERINRSLRDDWFLLPYECRLQRAHARVLLAAGILTAEERAALGIAIDAMEREFAGVACPESDAEDLHTWFELQLTQRAGHAGKKIHTARSRNDQVATLIVLFLIDAGLHTATGLAALSSALAARAEEWADTAMPMQTHAQFAAPGTAGFWALRYAFGFERLRRRTLSAVAEWKRCCPLGSGAVAGSSIAIDRRLQASELGFGEPSPSALYATSTRDECVEFLALGAQAALHLQSFAADVIGFAQTPFRWIEYPPEFGTGSSMMPNKRNPDAMELMRGEATALAAGHGQALMLLKGLPSGYNRDLQCIKPIVREAAVQLDRLIEVALPFASRMAFRATRLTAALQEGHIDATLRMEQKVRAGRPLREAHHETAAEPGTEVPPVGADVVSQYQTLGSAHPAETRRVAREIIARLESETLN